MNYALNALWFQLKNTAVRDLASLLTAPSPWHSECELPIRTLLGEQGFRFLLKLDNNPAPLESMLAIHAPFHHRLGRYAETLLAFWFQHAPHAKLLAQNVILKDHQRTTGELDFIVELNQKIYHIELCCKYYGGSGTDTTQMVGLNPQDNLSKKINKIQQQLSLSKENSNQLSAALKQQHSLTSALPIDFNPSTSLIRASIIRGMLFTPQQNSPTATSMNKHAWLGILIHNHNIKQMQEQHQPNTRYAFIPKLSLLSPLRIPENQTILIEKLNIQKTAFIATLQKRPDHYWHEIQRTMIN